ncbi:hypothetical protein [Actinomadura chibensis]|uniref:Uncharacterized protein n=1 Tax=Actinomadura chibensis TaxID=392828 RepID=A0A5D0NUM5_9ACTN|nr:hypothetical protein [Actinomadura chibensis]TYB47878.1 hypothetical protein FXF69_01080 [Actinomadura chibensis]
MSNIRRTVEKRQEWGAWAGSVAELRRIGEMVEQSCLRRRVAILAMFDEKTREILEEMGDDRARYREEMNRQLSRESLARSLDMKATIVDGDDKVSGPLDILGELDRRTVECVQFEAECFDRTFRERVFVEFKKPHRSWESGARLVVESSDQGWGRQIFVSVAEQIEKGVPRWQFVHNFPRGTPLLFLIVYIVLYFPSIVALLPTFGEMDSGSLVSANILLYLVCLGATFLLTQHKVRAWVFPQFDITSEMGDSTGSRRLIYIATLLASIPTGILVNLIS